MANRVTKDIAVVGGFTGLSRVLGFVRDMVMAWLLGAGSGPMADAFIVAFRIPNLLRRFMAEGAVSVAFVPVFSEIKEKEGLDRAFSMARGVFTWMFLLLTLVVIAGEILAPALVSMIAPGFLKSPAFDLTVELTRIMFPYILLIGIVALFMGILNSIGHFAAPAAAPILLNVFMIGVPVVFYVLVPVFESPAHALAWGVILGGIAQVMLQIIPLKRLKVPVGFSREFKDPRLRQVGSLMGVAAVGASVYQINVLVGTLLASLLATGSVSYLYYSNRLIELPLGIFVFAVGNVMLPAMSRAYARTDKGGLEFLLGRSLFLVLLFTLPATIGMCILAEPILSILFMRGEFTQADVVNSAYALQMYSFGLCAVGIARILTQTLYSMQLARIVVRSAWITLLVNILLCIALMTYMDFAGIALAGSLSMVFQVVLLLRGIKRQGIGIRAGELRRYAKILVAAIIMGICIFPYTGMSFWVEGLSLYSLSMLMLSIITGIVLYFVMLLIMGFRYSKADFGIM